MQTIIAAFDQPSTAQQAVDSLLAKGFNRSALHLQSGYTDGMDGDGTSQAASGVAAPTNTGFIAGVEHFFANLFGGEDESTRSNTSGRYVDAVRKGNSVLAVDVASDDEADQASNLLYDLGATDVEEDGAGADGMSTQSQGMTSGMATGGTATGMPVEGMATSGMAASGMAASGMAASGMMDGAMSTGSMTDGAMSTGSMTDGAMSAGSMTSDGMASEGAVLPIVQEELQVGKRTVQGGTVRVIKRVTETPVSELVRLREEHAVIERRPVDRVATEADFQGFTEGTIEMRESAEEAVVGKTARVVEEVVVGTKVTEHEQTVSDTVRRTDVEVDRGTDMSVGLSGKGGAAVSDSSVVTTQRLED